MIILHNLEPWRCHSQHDPYWCSVNLPRDSQPIIKDLMDGIPTKPIKLSWNGKPGIPRFLIEEGQRRVYAYAHMKLLIPTAFVYGTGNGWLAAQWEYETTGGVA